MKGKLDINKVFSMPIHAPHYLKPPIHYYNSPLIFIVAKANLEGVSQMVPDNVDVLTLDGKPLVLVYQAYYPFSDLLGPYNEAVIAPFVMLDNNVYQYVSTIFVDNDAALTCGREIWGYPKKFAYMKLEVAGEVVEAVLERPKGRRLMSTQLRIEKQASLEDLKAMGVSFPTPTLTIKVIPKSDVESKPKIEFVKTEVKLIPRISADGSPEMWKGNAIVEFNDKSLADPIYTLGPIEPIFSMFGYFDLILPAGTTIREY